jgi:hypothetical protein
MLLFFLLQCICILMYNKRALTITVLYILDVGALYANGVCLLPTICLLQGRRGRDRMVVSYTTICEISSYYH